MKTVVTKTVVTFAASLVLNLSALAALDWNAHLAQVPPAGQVFVTQLPVPTDGPVYASLTAR